MKKKKLQSSFIQAIVAIIVITSIAICYISIQEVNTLIKTDSETILESTCEKEVANINKTLSSMRKSVTVMANSINESFEGVGDIGDVNARNMCVADAEKMFSNIARNTESTVAYYFRFNHELAQKDEGFFFSKLNDSEEFVRMENTDITLYDKDDTERVGWYWQPIEAGKPVWMHPYYNKNNNIEMISYVIPVYKDDIFVGVVGMDFDYTQLTDNIDRIKVYENGFAYLTHNDEVVHHRQLKAGVKNPDVSDEYKEVSSVLENGMDLVLAASYDDINESKHQIIIGTASVIILFIIFAVFVALVVIKRLVAPIIKLTEETSKVASGDYNISIGKSRIVEINNLAEAFKIMAAKIKEHDDIQQNLAFRDSLTGLKNTTSYRAWVNEFSESRSAQNTRYGILFIDINYLKETNDTYGHDAGNRLICAVAQIVTGVFKRSPVFRIGGDEFAVVLMDRDFDEHKSLIAKLDEQCRTEKVIYEQHKIPISIARGFASFEPEKDKNFIDVFNRADDAMYEHKRKVKNSNAGI